MLHNLTGLAVIFPAQIDRTNRNLMKSFMLFRNNYSVGLTVALESMKEFYVNIQGSHLVPFNTPTGPYLACKLAKKILIYPHRTFLLVLD